MKKKETAYLNRCDFFHLLFEIRKTDRQLFIECADEILERSGDRVAAHVDVEPRRRFPRGGTVGRRRSGRSDFRRKGERLPSVVAVVIEVVLRLVRVFAVRLNCRQRDVHFQFTRVHTFTRSARLHTRSGLVKVWHLCVCHTGCGSSFFGYKTSNAAAA